MTAAEIFERLGGTSLASWQTMLCTWRRAGFVVRDDQGLWSVVAPADEPASTAIAAAPAPIEPLPARASRACTQAHALARVARGDHSAWSPFWADVERFVAQQLGRHGIRHDEMGDALQDVQARVFANAATFDSARGGVLTWVGWQVRATIREIRERRETIHVPPDLRDTIRRVRRGEVDTETLGQKARARLDAALAADRVASLDAPIGGDVDAPTLLEAIASPDGGEDALIDAIDRERDKLPAEIRRWRDGLKPRSRLIFDRRIACDPQDSATLKEVGDALGLSRERVRQLESVLRLQLRERLEASNPSERARSN